MPDCLVNLTKTCIASGACVHQVDPTSGALNTCYANGVTETALSTVTGQSDTVTQSYRKHGSLCYTLAVLAGGGTTHITVSDAAGNIVAEIDGNDTDAEAVTTCTGQAPLPGVLCPGAYRGGEMQVPDAGSCTPGDCSP